MGPVCSGADVGRPEHLDETEPSDAPPIQRPGARTTTAGTVRRSSRSCWSSCSSRAVSSSRRVRYTWCRGADGAGRHVRSRWPTGATGDEVAGQLAEAGVIRCGGFVGNLLMQQSGRSAEIRAGTYDLTTGMTLGAALDVLTVAPVAVPTVEVTIPEGYRITQIADRRGVRPRGAGEAVHRPRDERRPVAARRICRRDVDGRGLPVPGDVPVREGRRDGEAVADTMLEQFATEARAWT